MIARISIVNVLLTMRPLIFATHNAHRYNALSVELILRHVPFLRLLRHEVNRNS